MNLITLNIYPQGHYHWIPLERLYQSGIRIVKKFLEEKLIEKGEYSLLLYSPDRVKIEIATQKDLDVAPFIEMLDKEKEQCTITCWEKTESDKEYIIRVKCEATKIREEIIGDKSLHELKDGEWIKEIKHVIELVERKRINLSEIDIKRFLHLIMNPIGYEAENRILSEINHFA